MTQGHATTESLKERDYVLVLDKSGSMVECDTPTGKSRWEYAQESTLAIATECQKLDPDGITVVPFSGGFKVYESTTPDKVKEIFKENSPMGGTLLAPALQAVFDGYLSRKKAGTAKANGELVLVVTDGCPSDEAEVALAIIKFTKQLDNDEEYGISFIQIGKDSHASAYLKRLDDNLESQGAKFDIVDTKTMEELENVGLTEALLAALND